MYTLAIDDFVTVPVKFTLKDKGVNKLFGVTLECRRLSQDEISEKLAEKESKVKDFVAEVVTGWSGQRLVLDEGGQPAEYSPEALGVMLNAAGVAMSCFNAYLKECGAKEKN